MMDKGAGDHSVEQNALMAQLKAMSEEMNSIKSSLHESTEIAKRTENTVNKIDQKADKILSGQEVINEILEDSGAKDKAQIKKGFQFIMKKSTDMHVYCKTFYWTLLNYL